MQNGYSSNEQIKWRLPNTKPFEGIWCVEVTKFMFLVIMCMDKDVLICIILEESSLGWFLWWYSIWSNLLIFWNQQDSFLLLNRLKFQKVWRQSCSHILWEKTKRKPIDLLPYWEKFMIKWKHMKTWICHQTVRVLWV